jgi:CHAT domain
MGGGDSIIPIRMSLSVRPESPQLVCAFSYNGEELSRTATQLLHHELLRGYREEIASAAYGLPSAGSGASAVRSELRNIVPEQVATFLRKVIMQKPEGATLALEIMLNDPEILDCYPWELLSERGLLVDRKIAVVVWRSVPGQKPSRRPSSAALLVGSASFDTASTNAPNEIAFLAKLLRDGAGIHPYPHPSITFAQFTVLLKALEPAAVHIITHGNISGFQFQEDPDYSRSHADIPAQEIGTYLAESSTANLIVLNACYSASSWDDRASMARRIAAKSSTTAIGMSAEIPNIVGFDFSKGFFRALVAGRSLIEAFGSATHAIRQSEKFTTLWSTPIMYAPPDSNVVLFPANPMGQIRLRFQELGRQLRQLDFETAALTDYTVPQTSGSTPSIGAVKVRLAYACELLDDLGTPTLEGPEHVRALLQLEQVQEHAGRTLGQLRGALDNLRDPRRSRGQRVQAARSIRATLGEQIRAFAQLEREFSDS